jgi:predicted alpha/beta superfamily hydrolase
MRSPSPEPAVIRRFLFSSLLGLLAGTAVAAEDERPHTAGPGVIAFAPPLRFPGFGFPRPFRLYLPADYQDGTRRYPVIYMFDGQNLFDEATSYAGEWGVDEALDRLAREDGFAAIVVGIDHGGALRFNELIPYFNLQFSPNKGAAFVRDVVQVIKPFVDANFRTRPARADTVVMGSSLGGLAADYAVHAHPDVFGKAGVFSPSYWVSELPFQVAAAKPLPAGSRVYLYMGGREGDDAVWLVQKMERLLRTQPGVEAALHVAADATHDEAAWRAEFPRAVRWLFGLPARPEPRRAPAAAGPAAR